jgi:hypothetical protein
MSFVQLVGAGELPGRLRLIIRQAARLEDAPLPVVEHAEGELGRFGGSRFAKNDGETTGKRRIM